MQTFIVTKLKTLLISMASLFEKKEKAQKCNGLYSNDIMVDMNMQNVNQILINLLILLLQSRTLFVVS